MFNLQKVLTFLSPGLCQCYVHTSQHSLRNQLLRFSSHKLRTHLGSITKPQARFRAPKLTDLFRC